MNFSTASPSTATVSANGATSPENLSRLVGIIVVACLGFVIFLTFGVRLGIRTKLKARSEAHVPTGVGASKKMKQLIESELNRVSRIVLEPLVLDDGSQQVTHDGQWRHKIIDAATALNRDLYCCSRKTWFRPPSKSMEEHLKDLEAQDLLLTEFQDWKKLAHLYNKARFGHEVCTEDEFVQMENVISKLKRRLQLTVPGDHDDRENLNFESDVDMKTFSSRSRHVNRRFSESSV
ncbi:uncharacterized protein LOC134179661 [Corticium candelabrum]|uniref:uncharacterized protein LOC134179661 n=1 Tax=Corticium candelabrum TaxID=121492 RepID=UPI002E25B691|nr:uncharacterized protein LOC134179661 [Corticium candelabrum]